MRKVVVLHGWGNTTAPTLDAVMKGFLRIPSSTLFFPQAPIVFPEADYADVCRRMGSTESFIFKTRKSLHFTWWDWRPRVGDLLVPPGTKLYHGLTDMSLPFLREYFQTHGPFDVIVGFSQGALMSVLLATLAVVDPDSSFRVKGVCVIGSPQNNESVEHAEMFKAHKISVPSLVLSGTEDKVCKMYGGEKVLTHFTAPMVMEYPGGHHFPRDEITQHHLGKWLDTVCGK